nr:helix-turn-helix transcriptional regulator [Flavihumibacter cheonanensis]
MVEQLASELSLEKLANLVNTSPRNLSRIFKEATGITIGDYLTKIRIEKAKTLKNNPDYTIEYIAAACGFKSPRQLQRILKSTD